MCVIPWERSHCLKAEGKAPEVEKRGAAVRRGEGAGGPMGPRVSLCIPMPSAAPRGGSHRTLLVSFLSPSYAPNCFIFLLLSRFV